MIARLLGRLTALWVALKMVGRRGGDAGAATGSPAGGPGSSAQPLLDANETDRGFATRTPNGEATSSPHHEDPSRRDVPANPRNETIVAGLLFAAAVLGFGFTTVYVVASHNTQLLGATIGGMFALLAAGAIIAGKGVVVQETAVEDRGTLYQEEAPEELTDMLSEAGEGVSRRLLLTGAAGVAGAAVTVAAVTPAASLGPRLTGMHKTPWHRGVRMVDETGRPYPASEIVIRSFFTALPEGGDWESLGAGILLLRLPESMIHLPPARRDWAPQGIMAFSKICPHAACAVSLYRYPQFPAAGNVEPALTCPCHYSTFLPGEGGRLLFGPAGRPLPQLPVMIDSDGNLRAAGGFDEDVGPSWLDVRRPTNE